MRHSPGKHPAGSVAESVQRPVQACGGGVGSILRVARDAGRVARREPEPLVRPYGRMTRGIWAVATYGLQKSIDNASTFGGGGGAVAQNDQNLRLERGIAPNRQATCFSRRVCSSAAAAKPPLMLPLTTKESVSTAISGGGAASAASA